MLGVGRLESTHQLLLRVQGLVVACRGGGRSGGGVLQRLHLPPQPLHLYLPPAMVAHRYQRPHLQDRLLHQTRESARSRGTVVKINVT